MDRAHDIPRVVLRECGAAGRPTEMPIGYQSHGGVLSLGAMQQDHAMTTDGRTATKPYRVRAGGIWYWVDPTARDLEPGDVVLLYAADGQTVVAELRGPVSAGGGDVRFASLEGETFAVAARDIAALHLASVDDIQ
jgi:hypothetical protein